MEEMILYYSDICPDTEDFVNQLEDLDLSYQAVNITESMANLKSFLKLRDYRKEFEVSKEENRVGIPVLLMDNSLIFDVNELERVKEIRSRAD